MRFALASCFKCGLRIRNRFAYMLLGCFCGLPDAELVVNGFEFPILVLYFGSAFCCFKLDLMFIAFALGLFVVGMLGFVIVFTLV